MMSSKVLRAGALLAGCYVLQTTAYAQSFDCSKASTAIEHAICEDKQLRELDEALARDLKSGLAAVPDQRQWFLTDQRRWLAYRDKRCRDVSPLNECLISQYYARIRHLQAAAAPSGAVCQRIADSSRPPAIQYSSGTTLSWSGDSAELHEWARTQTPPFVIDPELMDALKQLADETGTIGTIAKMPGRDFYALTHEQGSAHCLTSQFFTVENGHGRPVQEPAIFVDDGGASCGAGRGFALIGDTPALVQGQFDRSPSMFGSRVIVTWDQNLAASGCSLTYSYAPKFGPATFYKAKETCEGPLCDGLRAAARELVEAVQKSPKQARERLQNRLTAAQRAEYDVAIEPLMRTRGVVDEQYPDYITDFVPMLLPYIHGGKVYVVSLGHFKPYGEIFADWSVKFESFTAGKLAHSAAFPIGMERGELEDVSIALKTGP